MLIIDIVHRAMYWIHSIWLVGIISQWLVKVHKRDFLSMEIMWEPLIEENKAMSTTLEIQVTTKHLQSFSMIYGFIM